jgi:hypothetical protein
MTPTPPNSTAIVKLSILSMGNSIPVKKGPDSFAFFEEESGPFFYGRGTTLIKMMTRV